MDSVSGSELIVGFAQFPRKMIRLKLRLLSPAPTWTVTVEMEYNDMVLKLKEEIAESESIVVNRIILRVPETGEVMQDSKCLNDYGLVDGSEIHMQWIGPARIRSGSGERQRGTKIPPNKTTILKPSRKPRKSDDEAARLMPPPPPRPPQKLKLLLAPQGWPTPIPVEVSVVDKVETLREEIAKVQGPHPVDFPRDRSFFSHEDTPLTENMSFESNGILDGDTIDLLLQQ